jgi:phosphatidylinositol alpha-1,6-mannosyltransferase
MHGSSLRVLALVTDAFGGYGGIAQYNRDLCSALAACESITDVVVLPRAAEVRPGELPLRIRQLDPVRGRLTYSLAALWTARTEYPIDVVFCGHLFMAPLAALIAKLVGARLWVQVHGTDAWQELSAVCRHSVETAALVTSVSRYTRRRLLQWAGVDPARVKVLPDTVDPRFRPGAKPGYLINRHALDDKQVLMTVSRLVACEQQKGQDRVIRILPRVLREHPNAVYIVVGEGDDRPRLKALAEQFEVADKVIFAGRIAADELPDYYRLADLFVMPSTCEGFGIVFLEAMASGIPVIGGNKDGSIDPLGDGILGKAIDPEDEAALASGICSALRRPAVLPEGATRFSQTAFSAQLRGLVASVIGDRHVAC